MLTAHKYQPAPGGSNVFSDLLGVAGCQISLASTGYKKNHEMKTDYGAFEAKLFLGLG